MTNFIRYDSNTGVIIEVGTMNPSLVQSEIDEGRSTMFIGENDLVTSDLNVVNLMTMTVVSKPNIAPPSMINSFQTSLIPETPSLPIIITVRQFIQQLAIENFITKNEALDYVKSNIFPASLQSVIDGIEDPDIRFNVDMFIHGSPSFTADDSSVNTILQKLGKTQQDIDSFFSSAVLL